MHQLVETLKVIWKDLDEYIYRKGLPENMAWLAIFIYPATWPILVYRFGHYIKFYFRIPFVKQLLYLTYFIFKRLTEILTTIEISEDAKIGKGLFIAHLGSIVIGHGTTIGKHASFHQGVTVGGAGRASEHGSPVIGDRVYFAAGCKVVGKITIGNDVTVGANAVVINDIPDEATVGGIPAKILNYKGSFDFIHYRGKPNREYDE